MSRLADRQVRPGRFGVRAFPACALVVGLVAAFAGTSAGAENSPVLPDLIADPATGPIAVIYQDESGTRRLLRFNGYIHNAGRGALELRGSKPVDGEMSVVEQRVYRSEAGFHDLVNVPAPRVIFEPTDGHDHWHLRNAAGYSLWNGERTTQVAPAQKIGFCLIDSTRVDPWANADKTYSEANISFCGHGDPGANKVTMGISAGWRDYYDRSLPFQWVDISDVQPGKYSLRAEMDPDGVIAETDEQNPPAFTDAVVPGYVATPVTAEVLPLVSTDVTLQAQRFGNPDTREYRIVKGPEHGKVNKPVGDWFTDWSVRYTPKPDYAGQDDSFVFEAREKDNVFPREKTRAVAYLNGTGGAFVPSVSAAAAPGASSAEHRRAPDVPGPLPALEGVALAAPQVHIDHGDLIVRTVAAVSGVIRMVARGSDGVERSCQESIPAGTAFTCLLGTNIDDDELSGARVLATLRAGGQVLGATETSLP